MTPQVDFAYHEEVTVYSLKNSTLKILLNLIKMNSISITFSESRLGVEEFLRD